MLSVQLYQPVVPELRRVSLADSRENGAGNRAFGDAGGGPWRRSTCFFPAETGETGQKESDETIDGVPAMTYPTHLIPTTVVGSYPQPDWLVDRSALAHHGVPRVSAHDIWRIPEAWLEPAQDDATVVAI